MLRALLVAAAVLVPAAASSPAGDELTYLARDVYFNEGNGTALCAIPAGGGAPRGVRTGRYDAVAWSPDGGRLAFRRSRFLLVERADGRDGRFVASGKPEWFAWSPDGRLLAYVAGGALWVVAPDGTGRRRLLEPGRVGVVSAVWAPDGRRIYVLSWAATGDSELFSVDVPTTELRSEGRVPAPPQATLAPNLRRLVYVDREGRLWRVELAERRARAVPGPAPAGPIVWNRDSRRIAFVAAPTHTTGDLYVSDVLRRTVRRATATPTIDELSPAWRPSSTVRSARPCVAPPPRPPWR